MGTAVRDARCRSGDMVVLHCSLIPLLGWGWSGVGVDGEIACVDNEFS